MGSEGAMQNSTPTERATSRLRFRGNVSERPARHVATLIGAVSGQEVLRPVGARPRRRLIEELEAAFGS